MAGKVLCDVTNCFHYAAGACTFMHSSTKEDIVNYDDENCEGYLTDEEGEIT